MCEFSQKLIGWIDHELTTEEADEVEKHLQSCTECRSRVKAYKQVSADFDAYCEETLASSARRRANPWTTLAAATGAAAALFTLILLWQKPRIQHPVLPDLPALTVVSPGVAKNTVVAPIPPVEKIHRQKTALPVPIHLSDANSVPRQSQTVYFAPEESMIRISIPAEEVLPPGAVPQGMNFVADVTIAADGSAEGMRLRPRLAAFERRTVLP